MSTVVRRNRAGRASRRKEVTSALLEHVERLLNTHSWNELTLERICTESGVARSSFYLFFEDQEDLLTVLADRALELIVESGQGWFTFPSDGTKDDLLAAIEDMYSTYDRHAPILSAVFEAASYDDRAREQFTQIMSRSFAALTSHIVEAQRAGWIRPDINAESTALWLSWMGETGLRWLLGQQESPGRKMVQAYVDIVWNTLYEVRP